MKYTTYRLLFFVLLIIALVTLCSSGGYVVTLTGIQNAKLKDEALEITSCYALKSKQTPSLQLLKRRADSDLEKLIELSHYHGYFSANASYTIMMTPALGVAFHVDLGEIYTLRSFSLVGTDVELNPEIGKPITTQNIIDHEGSLLWALKKKGYAHAKVVKKEVIANPSAHALDITMEVDPGPLVHFGPLLIAGNDTVRSDTIRKHILWKEGDVYDPIKLEKSERTLEKTGLFSSVIFSHDETEGDLLPIDVHVQEGKHKSVGAGLSYTTTWGPGISAEWQNDNLQGKGERLSFRTELWKKYQTAILSLTKPHFREKDQDLIWILEYDKLHTLGFDARSYSISPLIQKRLNAETEFDFGGRLEWLHSQNFQSDHIYYLVKAPLHLKWSNTNNLLDPTKGQTVNVKFTPTSQLATPRFVYGINMTSLTSYHSLSNNLFTLAAKVVFGNIIGAARHTIPPPDRLYGGSENGLRGYRAYTVSPLHDKRIPIGGRSMLTGSLEARFRTQGALGWALFYDVGNVYSTNVPKITINQLQSVGAGIRYTTPIGPLRFDIAVPLNRRSNIDPAFQIYFSIGQSF